MSLAEKLVRLNRALQVLSQAHTEADLLERILDVLDRVFDQPTAAILLVEPGGRHLSIVASRGYTSSEAAQYRGELGRGIVGSVAALGQARLIPDVSLEPDYLTGAPGARSELAVPLDSGDGVLGVLDLERMEGSFTGEDQELLTAFAAHAAWALRHLRALAAIQERARRMEVLQRSAMALNSIHDPERLLAHILHLADEALGFGSVALLELNRSATHLVVKQVLRREGILGLQIPVGEGIVGRVFRLGQPERILDVKADPQYIPGGLAGGQSELVAPLRIDGEIIGVLDAEAEASHAFSEEDLEIFAIFGAQVATALMNARQRARLARQEQVVRNITIASHALNTIKEVEPLMQEILHAAEAALGLDRVALLMPDRWQKELIVRSARGYDAALGTRIPMGEGVTGRVALSHKAELVHDVKAIPHYRPGVEGGATEMAVPLMLYGELVGVLDTESPDPEAFDAMDLELFQAFAEQAAVAVHNAQMIWQLEDANRRMNANVEEMTRLNRELEVYSAQIQTANKSLENQVRHLKTLYEASRTLTASLDLKETLDTILQMTQGIVNSSAGAIKLIDEETRELKTKAEAGFLHEESASWDRLDLPLRIGDKTIGVFELIRDATQEMDEDEHRMLETLATHAAVAIENARLFDDTQRMYYDTLKSLARALEARDDYTRGHSERVAELALSTSRALGLPDEECNAIYNAALLHDIGKIGVRDAVLLKDLPLTDVDLEVIRQHPSFGNTILGPLRFLGKAAEWVEHHHERWDGAGYPKKLKGEEIPFASRIIGVADTYDAMTSSRPYRQARTHAEAMAEVERNAGKQFDPQVVAAFVKMMAVGRG